ncbi:MAG: hypothetical protein ABI596_07285 [Pyrinomonadaceae bacterium]
MRRTSLGFLFGIVAACLWSMSAAQVSAQIGIRIPRPRVEKRTSPTTNDPANTPGLAAEPAKTTSNGSSQAIAPANVIIDDGYTFFRLRGKKDYVDGKPIDQGWSLLSQLRLVGPMMPRRSSFKIVVSKAGAPLATTRCEGSIPVVPTNEAQPPFLPMTGYCYDDKQPVKGEGKFGVAVYFVNGDDDSERLVRNYEIEVHKVDRVRGTVTAPQADVPNYYVSRHSEVLSSILYLRSASAAPYVVDTRPDTFGENRVEIVYNTSTTDEGQGIGGQDSFMRCSVDGQRIELKNDRVRNQRPTSRDYQEIHTDRLAAEFKRGSEYKDEINFRQYYVVLPLTWGRQGVYQNFTKLEEHPGHWECTYREGVNVVRTWRWTVRPDGSVAPHPEESSAGLTLFPGGHLVETEIPAGGSFIDKRIFPDAVRAGFLYGHRWQSAEGKAMAARLPAKGKPWPVPSTAR